MGEDLSTSILSDITIFNKYARHLKEQNRRESFDEIVDRNIAMHIKKYPHMEGKIKSVYDEFVRTKKVLPSMRSMQFGGKAIEVNNSRIFNCAYLPINHYKAFSETMFLLLGGSGVGYSVQNQHIRQLPDIRRPVANKTRRYVIEDSIMGWADSVKVLMRAYFEGRPKPVFDFSSIREKGAMLITAGGTAPGPEPLRRCLMEIELILDRKKDGDKLTSIEAHSIECHIADAVLSGGIRRAALASIFSLTDEEMLNAKSGNWWELNPHFGRANNSAAILRHKIRKPEFNYIMDKLQFSGSGEPGIFFTNDTEWGVNPCFSYDTPILTSNGYKPIGHLEGKKITLVAHDGKFANGKVWKSGHKDLYEVKFAGNTKNSILCTKDHIFITSDGEEIEAGNLVGKRIKPFYKLNKINTLYTKLGFIQGDGVLTRLKSKTHNGIEINIGENDGDILELFELENSPISTSYYTSDYNALLQHLEFDASVLPERGLPKTYLSWEEDEQLQFLRGLYSANGSIIARARIAFKTASKVLAKQLKSSLSLHGIESYITINKPKKVKFSNGEYLCKESYDINITRLDSVLKFAEKIGFVHNYKTEALEELILAKAPFVVRVKYSHKDDVYDFTIDHEDHLGVIDGVIAHNCFEIGLRNNQMCNLTEINAGNITSEEDLFSRAEAATFIGTLQAGYTDFHYLRDIWKYHTEKDALLGVSMTGIASGTVMDLPLSKTVRDFVLPTNEKVAKELGIRPATRLTTVKPAGTTSLVLGTSSGSHAWHSDYYIRRMRAGKDEAITKYLMSKIPKLVEEDITNSSQVVLNFPQKAPVTAITRNDESAIDLLERNKTLYNEWVLPGHRDGQNTHNVSTTVNVKDHEWEDVRKWMWKNRDSYSGIAVLPFDGGTYKQAPFEQITKEEYERLLPLLHEVDLTQVVEIKDTTDLAGELACAGNACEIV